MYSEHIYGINLLNRIASYSSLRVLFHTNERVDYFEMRQNTKFMEVVRLIQLEKSCYFRGGVYDEKS